MVKDSRKRYVKYGICKNIDLSKKNYNFAMIGMGFGVLFWVLESAIHALLFNETTFVQQLAHPSINEIWMRLLVAFLFIGFGFYVNVSLDRLSESERRVSEMLSKVQLCTVMLDEQGVINYVNDFLLRVTGYGREEVINKNWFDIFIPAELRDEIRNVHKEVISGNLGLVGQYTSDLLTKSGERRTVAWSNTQFRYSAKGDIVGTTSFGKDITDHKEAEEALKVSEEKFSKAFDINPNLMEIVDLETRQRVEVNDAFTKISGYSEQEAVGSLINEVTLPFDAETALITFQLMEKKLSIRDYESTILTKDGRERPVMFNAEPLEIQGRNFALVMAQDITERKRAENELDDYQQRLRRLASELYRSEEETRRMIAVELHDHVGHDLAIVKMKAETLYDKLADSEYADEINEIVESMISSIKTVSSFVFELSPSILYESGLDEAVEWLGDKFQDQFGITCRFDGDGYGGSLPEEIQILLFRCIRELLMNVRKHSQAETVSITAQKGFAHYTITVSDDGVGFDPSCVGMLKHSSDNNGGGFGLFSITERLNYQGGSVEIDSKNEKGCRITLTIPFYEDRMCADMG